MRICVFGARGFLGTNVSKYLENFYEVTRFSSEVSPSSRYFDLNSNFDYDLKNFDCVIYFSWLTKNRNESTAKRNIEGLKKILKTINSNQKFIFISSLSVLNTNNKSIYAQSKKNAEKIVLKSGQIVLRPGMVVNLNKTTQEGMAKNIFRYLNVIKKSKLPIQFKPDIEIKICSIEQLNSTIYSIIVERDFKNIINLGEKFSVNNYIKPSIPIRIEINLILIKIFIRILSKLNPYFSDLNDSFKLYD